jgi:lysozyme
VFQIFPSSFFKAKKGDVRKVSVVSLLLFFLALYCSEDLRFYLRSLVEYPLHYKEYKHFGIRIPTQYKTHGIDVSKWQSRVDWQRVKNMKVGDITIRFAFIKATEGSWYKDPQFDRNWENTRKNGIIRGAYHFFLPNVSAKDQAERFIRTVKLQSGDLPPVVDVEDTRGMGKTQIQRNTKAFLNLLEKHYKVKPLLYTNRDFYKQYFADLDDFKGYRFWIAHYHVSDFDMPGDEKWHFWQHSDRGNINGINEPVDFNVFNGDSAALRKLCVP